MKSLFQLALAAAIGVIAPATAQTPVECFGAPATPCFAGDAGGVTTYPKAPPAAQPLRLHHISLFTPNHEALSAWYRDMLGFSIAGRLTVRRPDGVEIEIIRMVMDGVWLNISRVPGLTERDRRLEYAGWRHIAFGTGNVQQAWDRLKSLGANVVGNGRVTFDPPGYAVAFVRDPDGNFIEFYQDLRVPSF